MNRYDLHVARNQFDEFVKAELAPNGRWVMYQDAAARIAELEKDRDELQAVFDRCLESDQRAIKEWQEAHPGTDLVWPDRTKMVVWLLEKGNATSARIAELEAEVKMWRNEDKKKQTACEQMGSRIAKLEAAQGRLILSFRLNLLRLNPRLSHETISKAIEVALTGGKDE